VRYNSVALARGLSLRILHTSDWHLGHTLHDLSRWREHDAFLEWLTDTLGSESVDVMLLTGDIFDSANPSARSTQRWFSFLAEVRRRYPALDLIVVGGNHDSAARMDAPRPILESMNIHILGGLPRHANGAVKLDEVIIPITGRSGDVEGWVAAVPFLRPGDLPRVSSEAATAEGRLVAGMRTLYQQLIGALQERRQDGQAAVVTGHCLMAGAMLSENSERKIQGGNQDALPADLFTNDLTYVALGHLHLAQAVGRDTVRYAGSPLPLSMTEAGYAHQVNVIDVEGGKVVSQRALETPRIIEMFRIPADGPAPLDVVMPLVKALPERGEDVEEDTLPFVEVRISLEQPIPGLRRQVQEAMADRAARLVKLTVAFTGDGDALADAVLVERLRDIQPEEVFVRRYQRDHDGDPPPPLLSSFHELLNQVLQQGGAK